MSTDVMKGRVLAAIVALHATLLASLAVAATPGPDKAVNSSQAFIKFDEAIRLNPKSTLAYLGRGAAYETAGNFDSALADFNQAVRLDPKAFYCYMDRGRVLAKMGRDSEALADLDYAISLKPANFNLYVTRSLCWESRLDHDHAIADLTEAIRLAPDEVKLYTRRGLCWAMKHESDKALADANEAIRRAPDEDLGYQLRALAWLTKDDFGHAMEDLNKALKLSPSDGGTRVLRGALCYAHGEVAEARKDIEEASSTNPAVARLLEFMSDSPSPQGGLRKAPLSPEARRRMLRGDITISKETTYLTGPLDKDGYVDYVAALNEECSRGVTPENNAAVPLWQARGCDWLPDADRERFRRLLGIPALPLEGTSFIPLARYLREHPEAVGGEHVGNITELAAWSHYTGALRRPWHRKEMPYLAEWLDSNAIPLEKVREAARRTQYYSPVLGNQVPPMLSALLPDAFELSALHPLLISNAMRNLHQRRIEDAWHDVLSARRLACLSVRGPSEAEFIVALSAHVAACRAAAAVAHFGNPPSERAAQMAAELRQAGGSRLQYDWAGRFSRYAFLDAVQTSAHRGPVGMKRTMDSLAAFSSGFERPLPTAYFGKPPYLSAWLYNTSLDWDDVMRRGNSWFDRISSALAQPAGDLRRKELGRLDVELEHRASHFSERKYVSLVAFPVSGVVPPGLSAEILGDYFISVIQPSFSVIGKTQDRGIVATSLAELAMALAAYRGDHGSYPKSLNELSPKYLDPVPKDLLGDCDFHYTRGGEGYVLYSVGLNGKDDGGHDATSQPSGDDIVLDFTHPVPLATAEEIAEEAKAQRDVPLSAANFGGTKRTERTISSALIWLAKHQARDGSWRFNPSPKDDASYANPGSWNAPAAATALGLLPLLGAGQTHKRKGPYQEVTGRAIRWLVSHQKPNGDLSADGEPKMLSRGLATLALCEAFGSTHDQDLRKPAQKAINFAVAQQDAKTGGWLDRAGQLPDLFTWTWQVLALRSGKLAGLDVPEAALKRAAFVLSSLMADDKIPTKSGFKTPMDTGSLMGYLCGSQVIHSETGQVPLAYLLQDLDPRPDDVVYNCFATIYYHARHDERWEHWHRAFRKQVIDAQIRDSDGTGNWWNPKDAHAAEGGRLFQTAITTLTLEVYYQYLPIYKPEAEEEPAAEEKAK